MLNKFIGYILLLIFFIGIIGSIVLIFISFAPCSGEQCMIRLLGIIGLSGLIITVPIFLFIKKLFKEQYHKIFPINLNI